MDASPQGSVFCTSAFLAALGTEADLWLAEDDEGPALGAVVLSREGRPLADTHPFCLYQGILLAERLHRLPWHTRGRVLAEAFQALLEPLTREFPQLAFGLHHSLDDLRGVQWLHYHEPGRGRFTLDLYYTGLIDLGEDFDAYLKTIRPRRRPQLRRAAELGLVAQGSGDLELLDRLDAATFERQGLERDDTERRLVRSITKAALDGGFGELFVCRDGAGRALSATVFLFDARCGYYLVGANDPAGRDAHAGAFLFLESLRRLHARGLRRIDVLGVNSPNRGDFKTSFGARPAPYFAARWADPGRAGPAQ